MRLQRYISHLMSTYCEHQCQFISTTNPTSMNTMASGFLLSYQRHYHPFSPPILGTTLVLYAICQLLLHLLLGQVIFHTVLTLNPVMSCITSPQQNLMFFQSKVLTPRSASKSLLNLAQLHLHIQTTNLGMLNSSYLWNGKVLLFCSFKPYSSGLTFPKTHFRAL